jgi:putative spermidine/putrescine transport system permease protein
MAPADHPAQSLKRRHAILRDPLVLALLAPAVIVNLAGFVLPVLLLLRMSFNQALSDGGMVETVTLDTWRTLVADGFYLGILWSSVWLSTLVTIGTLVCAYPIALTLHRSIGLPRRLMTVLVIVPLLTSAVVRTFGWIALLGDQGLIPALLRALHVTPPRLIFNTTGVAIGLIEILMPYMIVSLLAGFGRLDPRLEQAAGNLGANAFTTFRRIVLPLSLPGASLGCLLCFVLSASSFVTPKLLGGGRVFVLATEIYEDATVTLNWPLAAALSIVILVLFGATLALHGQALRRLAT